METISASELKAKLLAVLDRVARTGEPVLVLKRGKPVARLLPPAVGTEHLPQAALRGTVEICGDVMSPAVPEADWEALSEP